MSNEKVLVAGFETCDVLSFFFFSSRRRHTRLQGDWSSDVCSSDLVDLFVTSDVSEKLKFLSEVVFEAGRDNSFGVDIERLLLNYSFGDFLNVGVGRLDRKSVV